jgi:hypothetical protein
MMTAKDAFGLIVRIVGFGCILAGYVDLFHTLGSALSLPTLSRYSPAVDGLAAAFYIVSGVFIFAGADLIARIAYRGK